MQKADNWTAQGLDCRLRFLKTNSFTPRSQLVSTFLRLNSLKQQQRQSLMTINDRKEPRQCFVAKRQRRGLQKLKENLFIHLPTGDYNGMNGPDLHRYPLSQSQNIVNRKVAPSFLEKCRIVTQSYDQLKKEVMGKINIKSNRSQEKEKAVDGIAKRKQQNQNQNGYGSQRKKTAFRRNKHQAHSSESSSCRHGQRYMEVSVADFMEESEQCISSAISKKFQQFRKENNKQSRSLSKNANP